MIRFLIDGYNFLNASGIDTLGRMPSGGTPLERNRLAMLDFLLEHLTPEEVAATVVVFDGRYSFWSGAEQFTYHGLTVRFAARYPDADSLLEEMIREHTSPKRLTVISSDHRIQRAAHRRRAKFVDSEAWYRQLCARHDRPAQKTQQTQAASDKEHVEISPEDLKFWLQEFATPPETRPDRAIVPTEGDHLGDKDKGIQTKSGPQESQDGLRDSGDESSDVETLPGNVEEWAEQLGLSPEELNLPLDSLENDPEPPKKARRRRKQ